MSYPGAEKCLLAFALLAMSGAMSAASEVRPFAPAVEQDAAAPTGHVTDAEVIDAVLSTDPDLDCAPFLLGIDISPHDPLQIQTRTSYGASSFPSHGSEFLLISTGDPDAPAEELDVDFAPVGSCAGDNAQITFTFDFPDLGGGLSPVQSIRFDFDFFSYEFPDFVGGGFNDYVYAYLDAPTPIPLDELCNAPVPPATGCLLTFDASGNPTNVDAAFFETCNTIGCDNPSGTPGWDDVFTVEPGDDAGRTGTLVTCSPTDCTVPVTPGVHTLTFLVGDAGDGGYTSVGLFDNLRCFGDLECEAPVTEPVCQPRLYAASHTGGQTAPGTLLLLDATSGDATPVGPIGFNGVGAMDFHPLTGVLYGVGRRPADNTPVLITIDPATGAGTEVGPLENSPQANMDLSFRNGDGTLFLTGFGSVGPCISLFAVDTASGLATEIGDTTTCNPGNSLAFDWSDRLRMLDNAGSLSADGVHYDVDPQLGTASPVNALVYSGFPPLDDPRPNGMDFDPASGIAYVSVNDGNGGQGPNYLATFDPATGVTSFVGQTADGVDGLAWDAGCDDGNPCTYDQCEHCQEGESDCPCELFGTAHTGGPTAPSSLYEIDPTTGVATLIGPVGFPSVGGIDFAADGTLFGTSSPVEGANLITIDPSSGAGALVGATGVFAFTDLSLRGTDGTLFGFDPGSVLHTIDTGTGAATPVGTSVVVDSNGHGIAFDVASTLWHAGNAESSMLDPATGAATSVAPLSFVGFPAPPDTFRITAMDSAPCSGAIWVAVNGGSGGAGPNHLGLLDPATGVVEFVGQTVNGLDGLASRHKIKEGLCSHSPVPDSDGDGDCDAIDGCPLIPNPGGSPAPFGFTVRAESQTDFTWAGSARFKSVRGDFTGSFDIRPYAYTDSATGIGSLYHDPTLPATGTGLWYLWAPDCPQGSWTSGGAGECALGVGLPGCVSGERDGNLP